MARNPPSGAMRRGVAHVAPSSVVTSTRPCSQSTRVWVLLGSAASRMVHVRSSAARSGNVAIRQYNAIRDMALIGIYDDLGARGYAPMATKSWFERAIGGRLAVRAALCDTFQ